MPGDEAELVAYTMGSASLLALDDDDATVSQLRAAIPLMHGDPRLILRLANNVNCTEDVLGEVLTDEVLDRLSLDERCALVRMDARLPELVMIRFAQDDPEVAAAMARSWRICWFDDEVADILMRRGAEIREALARNSQTSLNIDDRLSRSRTVSVRKALAAATKDERILARLANDRDWRVVEAVAANGWTPTFALERIVEEHEGSDAGEYADIGIQSRKLSS